MSKLHMPQRDSPKPSEVQTRVLTKKKIANYAYILTDQLGEGYSSKVYRGVNELNSNSLSYRRLPRRHQSHRHGTHQQRNTPDPPAV